MAALEIGVGFPQVDIGDDPIAIRDYAQAAEDLGYKHLIAYDHVLGSMADAVLKRVGEFADGWFPPFTSLDGIRSPNRPLVEKEPPADTVERVRAYARSAGRDPDKLGIQGFVSHANGTPDDWAKSVAAYRAIGATHLAFNTMKAGIKSAAEHIAALRAFREVI